jgi:uncharacterized membrane protein
LNLIRVMPAKGQDTPMQKSLTIARLVGPVLAGSTVTTIGWVLTCVGAFRIIAPQFANFIASAVIANSGFFTGLGIVLVALGGFITFKGYVA